MAQDDRQKAEPGLLLEGSEEALLERLAQARSILECERADAPALALELLALPPDARVDRLRQDPRFHTWGLCELLIAQCAEALEDPSEARHLATLALAGAERLNPERHALAVVEDLKARAWAAAGTACLGENDPAAAEDALRAAASCLAGGTGDLLVEARLLEFEAAVRRYQGRGHEAAGLLKMAAARYREIGDGQRHDRVLVERDAILQETGSLAGGKPQERRISR